MALADTLCPEHYEEIVLSSCVDPAVALARGYRTLTGTPQDRSELRSLGYRSHLVENEGTYPALLIPMHGADGGVRGHQVKPASPRVRVSAATGKKTPVKYESPPGAPLVVDVPAFTAGELKRLDTPVWITEGMKKTDALVSKGIAALGLTGVFNWRSRLGTLGDWEDIPLKGRTVVICFDADAVDNRNVQLAMARLGSWLTSKGAAQVNYLLPPAQVNGESVKGVDDYFAAGGTLEDLTAAMRRTPPGAGPADEAFSDAALADEVAEEAMEGQFLWVRGLGWMQWTGKVWRSVSDVEPTEAVRTWALAKFDEVLNAQSADPSRNLASQIAGRRSVLTKSRILALVLLSKGLLSRHAGDFDQNPDLLTVKNGTLHLPSGRLMPFDPDHMTTKMAGAKYVEGATHPLWTKALEAVPAELHGWYQERLGQSLTGYKTPDHKVIVCHGGGSNGKSTVVNTVKATFGQYGVLLSDRALLSGGDAHTTERMVLRGARYAVMEETPEARKLNTQALKQTTGSETITARLMRQDSVEFPATHSLFINTNHKPEIAETDDGTWRRLALLSFPYTFHKRPERLRGSRDRLGDPKMEYAHRRAGVREAALAWMVEGAQRWYKAEREMADLPGTVERDTLDWRAESDLVLAFCQDRVAFKPDSFLPHDEMYRAFGQWLSTQGHAVWSAKTFHTRFAQHSYLTTHGAGPWRKYVGGVQKRGWQGLAWATESDGGGPQPGEGGSNPFDGSGDTPPPAPPAAPVELVEDLVEVATEPQESGPAEQEEPQESGPEGAVGFDLETAGTSEVLYSGEHEGPFVRLSGSIGQDGEPVVHKDAGELIGRLERAEVIYGSNILAFDLAALAWEHGADYDALAAKAVDTLVLARLVDPPGAKGVKPWSRAGYYGLDELAKRLGHTGKSDDLARLAKDHGGFDKIPVDDAEYNDYLRGDLLATAYVYKAQGELDAYARREMRVASLQNRMTLNGWGVNEPLLAERKAAEAKRREEASQALHDEFGMPLAKPDVLRMKPKSEWPAELKVFRVIDLKAQYTDAELLAKDLMVVKAGERLKAPWASKEGRPALVKAFAEAGAPFYPRTSTGELALGKDALGEGDWYDDAAKVSRPGMLKVYGHIPAVRRLVELILMATGATSKYDEIARHVTTQGRVHPVIGATQASSRWSTRNPASANISKSDLSVREVFDESAQGLVHITCDLSQVDMRAMAALSQDPGYMELFAPGRDAHMEMAEVYFGERTAAARKKTKAFNHAGNYGQGARAVSERTGLDLKVCEAIAAAKERAYPRLAEYIGQVRDLGASGALLDNGFGRLMRCDASRAYTQAPALMGQGAARDIMCESLLRLDERAPWMRDALRAVIHDEVVVAVPRERAEEAREVLRDAFTWEWKGVPILCEVSAPGTSWADCYREEVAAEQVPAVLS